MICCALKPEKMFTQAWNTKNHWSEYFKCINFIIVHHVFIELLFKILKQRNAMAVTIEKEEQENTIDSMSLKDLKNDTF